MDRKEFIDTIIDRTENFGLRDIFVGLPEFDFIMNLTQLHWSKNKAIRDYKTYRLMTESIDTSVYELDTDKYMHDLSANICKDVIYYMAYQHIYDTQIGEMPIDFSNRVGEYDVLGFLDYFDDYNLLGYDHRTVDELRSIFEDDSFPSINRDAQYSLVL